MLVKFKLVYAGILKDACYRHDTRMYVYEGELKIDYFLKYGMDFIIVVFVI